MSLPRHRSSIPPGFDLDGPGGDEIALGSSQDNLDQTPKFDAADPEPAPEHELDQSQGW